MEKLLKPSEVAALLGLGVRKVYELAANNEIPVVKIGRTLRFKEADLEQWISEHKNK